MARGLSRRGFLAALGGAAAGAALPWAVGPAPWARAGLGGPGGVGVPVVGDPDAGTGFSLGVASGDPTADSVILWTRVDDHLGAVSAVSVDVALDPAFATVVAAATAPVGGDRTVLADVAGLPEPGRHYWYRFRTAGGAVSATGRTRTAPDPASTAPVRLAVTSCQDWQQGWYTVWRHVAAQDLDAVVFVGDYIYEYGTYTELWRVRVHTGAGGAPVGETYTLDDYRARYRLYRSDPDLRLAHRLHPFVCVWDDHEVAGDRWWGGAVNHGDDPGEEAIAYEDREAAGVQAFFEYLPVRRPAPVAGRDTVYRSLSLGGVADLHLLDSRTFRSQGVGGTNRNFNPLSNIDEPAISEEGRTLLGSDQKAWLTSSLAASSAAGRWSLVGNQLMVTPLNLLSLPDALGAVVADATQRDELSRLPVTYHRDGIPVNTDQWDGYQAERREVLSHLRDAGIADVVFLTGDIHIGWVNEVHVEQGDAPVGEPVAVELVCPGISSENFNERIGIITTGRPLPHGVTAAAGPAAMVANRHVRYVDFDSNGYLTVEVTADEVRAQQWVLANAPGTDPRTNPIEDPAAVVVPALGGAWTVRRGSSRVVPAAP